jgi:hypothetical protein
MRLARTIPAALVVAATLGAAAPAFADITGFFGLAGGPSTRAAKGISAGAGFLIVAFEFEYADVGESLDDAAPHIRTGMFNALLQTPGSIGGAQFYATAGAGVYNEELGAVSETNAGYNIGGGAKLSIVGPLRVRFDYRYFRFTGSPIGPETVHRFYVGANLKF